MSKEVCHIREDADGRFIKYNYPKLILYHLCPDNWGIDHYSSVTFLFYQEEVDHKPKIIFVGHHTEASHHLLLEMATELTQDETPSIHDNSNHIIGGGIISRPNLQLKRTSRGFQTQDTYLFNQLLESLIEHLHHYY